MQIRPVVRVGFRLIPALVLVGFSQAGLAQTRTTSPPPLPETTGQPTRRPPPVEKPSPAPTVEKAQSPAPPAAASEKRILVKGFTFHGVTLFQPADLAPVVQPYVNRELTLLEIYEAADRITNFYVVHGYTLASATVPAQKIADGVVRLQVIEGRLGDVSVQGEQRYSEQRVKDYLGAITSGRIYSTRELEDGLYRVNRMPGLFAKAVLAPGQQYGTSDLMIQASEKFLGTSAIVDNYGRDNLGEMRASASLTVNNPLRIADQVQVLGLVSEDGLLKYGFLGYSTLFMQGVVRASASYGGATFELAEAGQLEKGDVEGENQNLRAGLEYLLRGDKQAEASLSVGLNHTSANTDLLGLPISDTDITLYEFGALYTRNYPNLAVAQYLLTASTNFKKGSASEPEGQALRLEFDLQLLHPLLPRLDGYVHLNAVYSPDPLPDVTKYSVGGPQTVRGFAAAELRGDQGAFESLGIRTGGRIGRAQVFGRLFYDAGFVRRETDGFRDGISSVGVGTDVSLNITEDYKLNAKLDLSFPTHDPLFPTDEEDTRLFGTVSLSY